MKRTESVFLDGMGLGRILWCDESRSARFEPFQKKLRPLAALEWSDPVECREAVKQYAAEADLGTGHES